MAVAQSNKNNSSLQIKWIENTSLCNCHSVPPHPPSTQFGLIKATCTAALKRFVEKWQNYSRFKSGKTHNWKHAAAAQKQSIKISVCFCEVLNFIVPLLLPHFVDRLENQKKSLEDVQSWWGHCLLKRYFRSALKHCFPTYGMNWLNQNHLMLGERKVSIFYILAYPHCLYICTFVFLNG